MDLRKALLVAKWEFLTTITRRMYIFAVVAMPVFYGIMLGVAGFTGRSIARGEGKPIGVVDPAHVLDFGFAQKQADANGGGGDLTQSTGAPQAIVGYGDKEAALADLKSGRASGVFVIEPDYVATGAITAYSRDTGLLAIPADRRRQQQIGDAIRASLLHGSVSGDVLARTLAPMARVTRVRLDAQGRPAGAGDDPTRGGPFTGSFGVSFMLTMAIFFSAGFLQQATIEDRQNRMIEILLSSLDTDELLAGKIIGLGGAGLLQVAIYLTILAVPGLIAIAVLEVPLGQLALSLVYFVLGYLLFASLMAATGSLGRTAQESAQLSAIWTLTAASPMFFLPAISAAPNSWFARGLSFFPLTGPVTMMMRLSGGDLPRIDVPLSIAIGILAIYLALRAASKILRAASLMYGKRPTLPELLRWLRAA